MTPPAGLIDLAAQRVGGRVLLANDQFFAPASNLLKPDRPVFMAGKYTDRGKWMDGWETRRRRAPGNDWCIVRLGIPGVIRAVTVDTTHFRGNAPEACSLDGAALASTLTAAALKRLEHSWIELLPRSAVRSDAENLLPVPAGGSPRCTHVRLRIYPDGGVARLRVWGEARPEWRALRGKRIDLAAIEHGGLPLASSDEFFSHPLHLLLPGRPRGMAEGWETRRRRGPPGHDWVIVRLGHRGAIEAVEIDTTHFKGNAPESASLEAADAPGAADPARLGALRWEPLVPRTTLRGHARHRIALPGGRGGTPATHVRLNIFPDGGVARLRVWGRLVP